MGKVTSAVRTLARAAKRERTRMRPWLNVVGASGPVHAFGTLPDARGYETQTIDAFWTQFTLGRSSTRSLSSFRITGCGPNEGSDTIRIAGNLLAIVAIATCSSSRARFAPMQK